MSAAAEEMSDVTLETTGSGASTRALAWARTASALVGGIIVLGLVLHIVWLVRFRHGYVTEWDESAYLQYALSNFDALHDHGVWSFVKLVGSRGTAGPLLPFLTSLAYPIVGRGVFGSLLVVPLFYAGLVGASFGLARRLVSDSWAVLAALAVAAIPAVIDYARLFHFALPATACMTAALWALVRSERLRRTSWAAAFGFFVALMLLSRTMTFAFLPGLAGAALAQLLARPTGLRLRLRNLGLAAGVTVVVAGPWYVHNARSVYDNLIGQGYGEGATVFGRHYSIATWGYWTKELRLDLSYTWLPLGAVLLLSFLLAFAHLVARRRRLIRPTWPRSVRAIALLSMALVVIEGYLVLTTSRNEGTAFALPWIPALVVLGVTAASSIPGRWLRLALASGLVVVSVAAVASKSGWVAPVAAVRTVSVPGLGRVAVTDGRGIIQTEVESAGYDIGPITRPLPAMHRRWLPFARELLAWATSRARRTGEQLHLKLGLEDEILSNSRYRLAAQLWFHRYLPVDYLRPYPDGDTVAAYRRQLLSPIPTNALVIGNPSPVKHPRIVITRSKVEAAARSLGFAPAKSFTLPDGRRISVWWRPSGEASS
jgi:4-amino-4-deoxy-L-arabinose transferase-like glycosyltransferase